jgi:hypothetical protein
MTYGPLFIETRCKVLDTILTSRKVLNLRFAVRNCISHKIQYSSSNFFSRYKQVTRTFIPGTHPHCQHSTALQHLIHQSDPFPQSWRGDRDSE